MPNAASRGLGKRQVAQARDTATFSTAVPFDAHPEDVKAALRAVRQALADMRHAMDIRDEDGAPDRQGWIELERAAVPLMLRAYYRNHNRSVLA